MDTITQQSKRAAVTLIELTVVIALILILVGIAIPVGNGYRDWQQGVGAGERLQAVYTAQRLYLSDFPTTNVAALTPADTIPYLPDNTTALPMVEDLDGNPLTFNIVVSPPTLLDAAGTVYDPTRPGDGQWDVGR